MVYNASVPLPDSFLQRWRLALSSLRQPGKLYDLSFIALSWAFGGLMGGRMRAAVASDAVDASSQAALGIFFVAAYALYLAALVSLRRRVSLAPKNFFSGGDWALLVFLSVCVAVASAIFPAASPSGVPETGALILSIAAFFVVGGTFFAAHYWIMEAAGKGKRTASAPLPLWRVAAGLAGISPAILFGLAFGDALLGGYFETPERPTIVWEIASIVAYAAVVALLPLWLSYIPRKIAGAVLGTRLSGWFFYKAIALGFIVKLLHGRGIL